MPSWSVTSKFALIMVITNLEMTLRFDFSADALACLRNYEHNVIKMQINVTSL
mgnify:CR=1 FL=1